MENPRKTPFKACEKKKLSESRSKSSAGDPAGTKDRDDEATSSPQTAPNPAPQGPITLDAKEQDLRDRLDGPNAAEYYGATRRNLNDDFVSETERQGQFHEVRLLRLSILVLIYSFSCSSGFARLSL